MKIADGLDIEISHRVIGPSFDPYDAETLTIKSGEKSAVYYHDGLGTRYVKLLVAGTQVRRRDLVGDMCSHNKRTCNTTLANLIVKRHVGITCDAAEDLYREHYVEDPMGPLSRYI